VVYEFISKLKPVCQYR